MTNAIQAIPLSKLIPSNANARRTGRKDGISQLAASIKAHGLLQNLTVRPVTGRKSYEVIAGGRRFAALQILAKRKAIAPNAPIPCHVLQDGVAEEISLAENVGQCPMHPADQYEAFARLHGDHGMSAEDIAARFGVTAAVVRQRLKLGAVSPRLMAAYRKEEMNLDQLSAFAITEDHERQERVWRELPAFNRSREAILRALSEGQVRSDDRRALFVGVKAYEEAGGVIIRDLFDAEGGGFFTDADLLNRLARQKLQTHADKVSVEGWRWIVAEPELDREVCAGMRRVFAKPAPLSKTQREKLHKLQTRYDALCDKYPDGDLPDDALAKLGRIEAAIEALRKEEYKPQDVARAGAFVTLAHDGSVRAERGFIRPEDEPKPKTKSGNQKTEGEAKDSDGPAPLSEKLVAELTAYRTSALRNELAVHPATAFITLVHTLALDTFFPGSQGSCLEITPKRAWLSGHAPGIDDSFAEQQIGERHAAWGKRLPDEAEALWNFIHGLSDTERLDLLAHCVSLTANAIRMPGRSNAGAEAHSAMVAREVRLDMAVYWQPPAASYFGRVSKERIVEAMREGASEQEAQKLSGMKKQAMAEAAEAALAGKGWLPGLLRQTSDQTAA